MDVLSRDDLSAGADLLRRARDDDGPAWIQLIADVFAEYPGCILDVDGEMPELRRVAAHYLERGGAAWTVERAGGIVGTVACSRPRPGVVELHKLYVSASTRRQGLGARLCDEVERFARGIGASVIELWSDTRFLDAHRLYGRLGFERGGPTRELHDKSQSVEFYFSKPLK